MSTESDIIDLLTKIIQDIDAKYATLARIPGIDAKILNNLRQTNNNLKSSLRLMLVSKNIMPHVRMCMLLLQVGTLPLLLRKEPSKLAYTTFWSATVAYWGALITDIILMVQINKKINKANEISSKCTEYLDKQSKQK